MSWSRGASRTKRKVLVLVVKVFVLVSNINELLGLAEKILGSELLVLNSWSRLTKSLVYMDVKQKNTTFMA